MRDEACVHAEGAELPARALRGSCQRLYPEQRQV